MEEPVVATGQGEEKGLNEASQPAAGEAATQTRQSPHRFSTDRPVHERMEESKQNIIGDQFADAAPIMGQELDKEETNAAADMPLEINKNAADDQKTEMNEHSIELGVPFDDFDEIGTLGDSYRIDKKSETDRTPLDVFCNKITKNE